ncbi:galactofuranose ABC transporter, ATP-binding protein YtfR [Consotaella salsifontis]|uniref:Monosaccharide ABC transporter ATP-binding protein, CUT2 family n=1 Tax=Consotaella salsifontis TaxID=1365950 RepID=A0A1T4SNF9_9HYPH|nr:galactofuranose ABC transporter, ATP-binding protein YtfR [Consotaella salsifontis]SKA29742.1 monosaccharide ABC transporter ATP-binding protein, CUT2 family [Consotaella salsifontis]
MANETPLLRAKGVSKSFFGVAALDDVDFTLRSGEVHALLGENGAGKSTLIKVITGAYRRDAGEVLLEGKPIFPRDVLDAQALGIGTVYQEVNLLPNLSVAENLYLGRQPKRFGMIDMRAMNRLSRELLKRYGLDIDVAAPLSSFSVAIQQIIAIARAVDISGKVLILDEPTASLDTHEVEMLFSVVRQLRAEGLGIIFISHFLDQVFSIADTITVLRNGRLIASRAVEGLERIDLVSMMLGRRLEEAEDTGNGVAADTGGETVIKVRHLGKRGVLAPFDLDVKRGEVVGIAGLLGSGRTETAQLLFGIERADGGTVEVEGQATNLASPQKAVHAGFGFCPEDRKTDGIIGDLSVRENIALALQARRGWAKPLSRREQDDLASQYIEALDIRTAGAEMPVKFLSGGNQQKVLLARWLATNPRFLILDEPTRGIDVGAHAEIIRLIRRLCADGMSLLVISSELEELVGYSARVLVLRDRRHVAELVGEEVSTTGILKAIAASGTTGAAA